MTAKRKPTICVLINCDPHRTAHFWDVASELFRGTFVECEEEENRIGTVGFIWKAEYWDAGKPQ